MTAEYLRELERLGVTFYPATKHRRASWGFRDANGIPYRGYRTQAEALADARALAATIDSPPGT